MNSTDFQNALSDLSPRDKKPTSDQLLAGNKTDNILASILTQAARAKLNMIGSANPTKKTEIEGYLIKMATSGQLRSKLDEAAFKNILDQIAAQTESSVKGFGVWGGF